MSQFCDSLMEEKELIKGLQGGNERAYRQLFDLYFEPLTYFAYKYLEDLDASQDLVQEVFSSLYEKRENLSITQSLKSYLYRSVQNHSINVINHNKMKKRHHDVIKERSDVSATDSSIELQELELKILRSIDALPEQCARIFKMSRFEQLSNQEIADALGISKRTVETQISNALKELRKTLTLLILYFLLENF